MLLEQKVTVGIPTYNRAHLLGKTIESVLSQTYRNFQLMICDNASDDDTSEVVASYCDPRIEYVRSEKNIGMAPNFNRVLRRTKTDYVLVLPDDDLLYPEHLELTVPVLDTHPRVGVVHTAFDVIDADGRVLEQARVLVRGGEVEIEAGDAYLERSMKSDWTVCWPSALCRTEAIVPAGGHREEDLPLADFALLLRVACDWDFAAMSARLAATRVHPDSATVAVFDRGAIDSVLGPHEQILSGHRRRFLETAPLPPAQITRLRSLADATRRRQAMTSIADRAGDGASWRQSWRDAGGLVCDDPRVLLLPETWRFTVAQVGGRTLKRRLRGSEKRNRLSMRR